ncbi:MAG: cobalamin B12-binding domain-containing protein, partial [Candidatus Pacearchaeota archaeon]|nr:cobalamin B12-binding domain-containing protein [Candidatus Pacearchaeota archaeon]
MNFVLINAPLQDYGKVKKKEYYTTPPLGLGYLATIAQNLECRVNLIDAEAQGISPSEMIRQTKEWKPDVVGINITAPTLDISKILIRGIKDKTGAKMLAGGPDATIRPGFILDYIPALDLLVRGEGEKTLELLIKNGFNPSGINGVSFKRNK